MNEQELYNALGLMRKEAGAKAKLMADLMDRAIRYPAGKLSKAFEPGFNAVRDMTNKIFDRKLARSLSKRWDRHSKNYMKQGIEALKAPGPASDVTSLTDHNADILAQHIDRLRRQYTGEFFNPNELLRETKTAQRLGTTPGFRQGWLSNPVGSFDRRMLNEVQKAKKIGPYRPKATEGVPYDAADEIW